MSRLAPLLALAVAVAAGCGGGSGEPAPSAHRAGHQGAAHQAAGAPVRPAPRLTAAMRHRPVPVLMYHVIAPPPPGTPYPGLWVAPSELRAQVAALAAAGFRAVTLDQVLDGWAGRAALPRRPVVLTFDDGYRSQARAAGRILGARRWPGVLNLTWGNLGVAGMVTPAEVRQLAARGWEIDAHSMTHADLTAIGPEQLRTEVAGSRAAIRRAFGVPADGFCYPAGRFDATVEAAVRAAGYRSATTELPGAARPRDDRFALPRIRVDGGESATTVLAAVRASLGSGT